MRRFYKHFLHLSWMSRLDGRCNGLPEGFPKTTVWPQTTTIYHLPLVDVKQWKHHLKSWDSKNSDVKDQTLKTFGPTEMMRLSLLRRCMASISSGFRWLKTNILFVSLEHLNHQRHVCIKDTPILNAPSIHLLSIYPVRVLFPPLIKTSLPKIKVGHDIILPLQSLPFP